VKNVTLAKTVGIILLALCFASSADAGGVKNKANAVIAGILLEIPNYIILPNERRQLCVIENAGLSYAAQKLNQRKKIYQHIFLKNRLHNLNSCDVIHVSDKAWARKALTAPATSNKLIISDYHAFVDEGGTIAVLDNNGVIGIELNISAAKRLGISINPDLIEVSVRVIQ